MISYPQLISGKERKSQKEDMLCCEASKMSLIWGYPPVFLHTDSSLIILFIMQS